MCNGTGELEFDCRDFQYTLNIKGVKNVGRKYFRGLIGFSLQEGHTFCFGTGTGGVKHHFPFVPLSDSKFVAPEVKWKKQRCERPEILIFIFIMIMSMFQ